MTDNETLIIFKIDFYEKDLLIPSVNYEIYNLNKKQKLNLSLCDEATIKMLYPASVDGKNMDKYNPNSGYYNDECNSYSENGIDMTTTDRKNDFNNKKLSLCEFNCEYSGYNSEKNKSECECQIKIELPLISQVVINKEKLFNFKGIKNSTNFKILKCYYVVFTKEGLKSNIGSYILLSIILIDIITLILFLFKGYKHLSVMMKSFISIAKKRIKKKKNKNKNKSKVNATKEGGKNKINNIINKNNIKIIIKNKNFLKQKKNKKNKNNPPKIKRNKSKNKNKRINIMKTSGEEKRNKTSSRVIINKKINSFVLDVNKDKIIAKGKKTSLIKYNDFELNTLLYKEALKIDKRKYFHYYFSLLKRNQILLFSFYTKNDYNLRTLKITRFFFFFALSYTVNALFFNDDTFHNILLLDGKYNFIYQIPKIIYSSLISSVFNILILSLSLTEKNLIEIKREKTNKMNKYLEIRKLIIIKLIAFYIIIFIFLGFFWYYISCFCAIYKNTQVYLIKDTLINFSFSCLYPIFLSLFPGIFRFISLRSKKQNKECMYKFSKFIQYI